MNDTSRGQVTKSAAEIYDEFFVPALFQEWAPRTAQAAGLAPGQTVLDIACGTGVLAREAARRVSPRGTVTGLDRNEGMLAVARRSAPDIDWRLGVAESLPFEDATFDAVLSQFGLMFFDDRTAALKEMWRVLRSGGRLSVAVWDQLEQSPGYASMVVLLQRLFGDRIANELRAPFALGDRATLASLAADAGIPGSKISTYQGMARFPSLEDWVRIDVKGWTLADLIDDTQFDTLLTEAKKTLGGYEQSDGTVAFQCPAHIVRAAKP